MLLAVDSSTAQIGLALIDGNQIIAETIWRSHQRHTVELASATVELLNRTSAGIDDVDALAVATGPGSFTALRAGLAFIKGLAISRKIPVVGVPTLDILAAAQPPSNLPLATVLSAGRNRIAVGWYKHVNSTPRAESSAVRGSISEWEAQGEAEVTTLDILAKSIDRPTILAGEFIAEERQRLARKKVNVVLAAPHLCIRRPSLLAEIGWSRHRFGQANDVATLAPSYLQLKGQLQA